MHLKIIPSTHLKMHLPWYMNRKIHCTGARFLALWNIRRHVAYTLYPLNSLKTASTMVNEIHCTGTRFLVIMEQSFQHSLSFYRPSYCVFICSANYEPQPWRKMEHPYVCSPCRVYPVSYLCGVLISPWRNMEQPYECSPCPV